MKTRKQISCGLSVLAVALSLPMTALAVVPVALTVPWVPKSPGTAHVTIQGKVIHLKGTSSEQGPTIMATWDPGDGSPVIGPFNVSNQYDASVTFAYSEAPSTTVYTAVLTIQDTSCLPITSCQSTAKYPVLVGSGQAAQIDVAIDEGLWYLHTTMGRWVSGGVSYGGWLYNNSGGSGSGEAVNPKRTSSSSNKKVSPDGSTTGGSGVTTNCSGVVCDSYPAPTATSIQAFEVSGHFQNGPKTDPYSDDVYRGMNVLFTFLTHQGMLSSRTINGTTYGDLTYKIANPSPIGIYVNTSYAPTNYQSGQILNAIVASGSPKTLAPPSAPAGIAGRNYKEIAQAMVNDYVYGLAWNTTAGGGWDYSNYGKNSAGDNSASQWAAIGIISAVRSFGCKIDPNALLWNQVWVNSSQAGNGEFGYRSNSPIWGPYADTPSGMVQMAMDGVGRGDPRWDAAECFLTENFDQPIGSPGNTLQTYTYGMYSFTKAMLLHDPGGVLTPIQYLGEPCGQSIDWYGDPNYGIATRLLNYQNPAGYWSGNNYSSAQYPLETGSAIVMLRKTIFTQCVSDLAGTPEPQYNPPAVLLKWSGIPNVSTYNVLRATTEGGPYTQIGATSKVYYADNYQLQLGETYYYVLQPIAPGGSQVCQSNEAVVVMPQKP